VRVAVIGVNGRGTVLARSVASLPGGEVAAICDVDSRAVERTVAAVSEPTERGEPLQSRRPEGVGDFRTILDDTTIDAVAIATPEHWQTSAALLALQAGKHVYLEKPGSVNPSENLMLVEGQARYGKVVHLGTQQRASVETRQIIEEIHGGLIGRAYFGRAWYGNRRRSIGRGKVAPVPEWLDYELWQGPAPRTPYRDNTIHYNWHWFRRWGTGEICNNATHELDVCRWALQAEYPTRVTSAGGRYHYDDDWEYFDTQVATFDFEDRKTITWEGRSCNGARINNWGRGASIHGEKGWVMIGRNGYVVFDNDNNEVWSRSRSDAEATMDTRGGGGLTDAHMRNFFDAVRGDAPSFTPIQELHKSVMMCHLGNIAQFTGEALDCDPETGVVRKTLPDGYWTREYEPGWEPKI
jgi:predicted dehydrogenase